MSATVCTVQLTDVERVSLVLWDPVFVNHDELLDELCELVGIEGRKRNACC